MKNYAEKSGYALPRTHEEVKFTGEKISNWALDAVKEMHMAASTQKET